MAFSEIFIHFQTKVCVTSGENCFPQRCMDRLLNINPNMANDAVFTGGGLAAREENVFDEEFMSNAYYLPPDDPKTQIKKFWKDILDINREKVDRLMTDTNGTMHKRNKNNHNRLYQADPIGSRSGGECKNEYKIL